MISSRIEGGQNGGAQQADETEFCVLIICQSGKFPGGGQFFFRDTKLSILCVAQREVATRPWGWCQFGSGKMMTMQIGRATIMVGVVKSRAGVSYEFG